MTRRVHRLLPIVLALVAIGLGVRPALASGSAGDVLPPAKPASALPTLFDSVLSPAQRAERAYLEHLGWRFVTDPSVKTITVLGGTPCRRTDLAAAQAAGDLRIAFPPSVTANDASRFASNLPEIADSIPTRCAWQFLVAPAVERATKKFAENEARGRWTFPQWLFMNAQIFSVSPPKSQWVKRSKLVYSAREKPSAAIEAFYNESASTECFVAQTVTAYAIQYEIYGAAWFDAVFKPEELTVGQVGYFHATPLGRVMRAPNGYPWRALFIQPSNDGDDKTAVLARLGPQAFAGMTGILMDHYGSSRSNQNFTFVSVSPAAADAIVRDGGFDGFSKLTQELLTLHRGSRGSFKTGADLAAIEARTAAILAMPVFREIRVFIHPYGVKTLAEMVAKLRVRDDTAVELILYDEAREDTFFQRYREAWKARWSAAAPSRPFRSN